MKDAALQRERPRIYRVANQLVELYQLQMDALQRDSSEAELEEYRDRRKQINELRAELGMGSQSRPS